MNSLSFRNFAVAFACLRTGSLRRIRSKPKAKAMFCSTISDSDRTHVPLVFLHGMKGSHLDSTDNRTWLSLQGLLNFPPKPHKHPDRDLSLPLTYNGTVQDRGHLQVGGLVKNILEIGNSLQLIPFYGHVSQLLQDADNSYRTERPARRTISRPTACFVYDWRRNLQELSEEFHEFCCTSFPDQPVQVLAHSMGGLISLPAIRMYPDKYRPGAVMVGVPFGTGIQYLQDLHLGYTTEIGRCRQFMPEAQFTFSSHWCFFPMCPQTMGDSFVDVTDEKHVRFQANKASIGKSVPGFRLDPVNGERIEIDFYNVKDWEKFRIGIFAMNLDQKTLDAYRNHMRVQLEIGREFRLKHLRDEEPNEDLPPLIVCATNTKPTVNQILRRKNGDKYEYDFMSGRTVPGDGRINFCGAFPPVRHQPVALQSAHAKQLLWEEQGGDLTKIMEMISLQLDDYQCSHTAFQSDGVVFKVQQQKTPKA